MAHSKTGSHGTPIASQPCVPAGETKTLIETTLQLPHPLQRDARASSTNFRRMRRVLRGPAPRLVKRTLLRRPAAHAGARSSVSRESANHGAVAGLCWAFVTK